MKAFFLVAALCVAGALAKPGFVYPQTQAKLNAIHKLGGISTPAGIIPPQNQTTPLPPGLNVTLDFVNLKGFFALYDGTALDLDQLSDTIKLNVLTLSAEGDLTIPTVTVNGNFEINGVIILNSGLHHVTGTGPLVLTGNGITAHVKIQLYLTVLLKVQIRTITLVPGIKSCSGSAEGALSDGEQIAVGDICEGIEQTLQDEWANHGDAIVEDVRIVVNDALKELTLQDLIDLIGGTGRK